MTNYMSNTFKQVSAWLYLIFVNPFPSKVVHRISENSNAAPLSKAMKQVRLLVPTALNNGEPVAPAALHTVENLVQGIFGACTLHSHLLGAWANDAGIRYRDPILLVEIEVEDSPTLLPSLTTIVRFTCECFEQGIGLLTMADVGVLSLRRDRLLTF
ncbi:MAG: hypothetical protein U0350_48745 [Caldilineaceae bacterium]